MVTTGLCNLRGRGTIIIASAAVITLLFLPLTVSINNTNSALLQSQSAFAQQQGGNQSGGGNPPSGPAEGLQNLPGGAQQQGGEQQEEKRFLPYISPIHGILIWYPSDWKPSTSGLADYTDLIAFYSPLQNLSDSFPARLTISVIVYSQNVTLPEYTNLVWTMLNQSEQVDVRSSSEVTVAGYPGHRVVLAAQPFQNSSLILHQMNTWTTIGNKVYLLRYEGEESTFNQHLPEVSQMLESLRITSNNMTTTATGVENQIQQGGNQSGGGGGPLGGITEGLENLLNPGGGQ
jgi:hypothetical protein